MTYEEQFCEWWNKTVGGGQWTSLELMADEPWSDAAKNALRKGIMGPEAKG